MAKTSSVLPGALNDLRCSGGVAKPSRDAVAPSPPSSLEWSGLVNLALTLLRSLVTSLRHLEGEGAKHSRLPQIETWTRQAEAALSAGPGARLGAVEAREFAPQAARPDSNASRQSGAFDQTGLTDLMRGRDWLTLQTQSGARVMVINDSVNKQVPTALLLFDPDCANPQERLRPLLEKDLETVLDGGGRAVLGASRPYVERQEQSQCSRHAVNAVLGRPVFSHETFQSRVGLSQVGVGGWADMNAVKVALESPEWGRHVQLVAPSDPRFVEFVEHPSTPVGAGAIVLDPQRKHFVAFTKTPDGWTRLDSLEVPADAQARSAWAPPLQKPTDYVASAVRPSGPDMELEEMKFEVALVTSRGP